MAEKTPSLQIDDDWKRQAQEEKQRLAEQTAQQTPPPSPASDGIPAEAEPPVGPASFEALVSMLLMQVLLYLGDLRVRGSQPMVDLDRARQNVDLLGMLEEKTRGNLTEDEKKVLDRALYEARMRFIQVASAEASTP